MPGASGGWVGRPRVRGGG
ncbi:hypothetical protein STRIP9103_03292, partial [Streptomyces ipomoeae 91-03]